MIGKHLFMGLSLLAALLTCPHVAKADGEATPYIVFSPYKGQGELSYFGTLKKENYDVAMHIADKACVGLTIEGLVVPVLSDNTSAMTVWLSKELKLETIDKKKVNVPDIMSQEVSPQTGWMEIVLDKPYTITEEGVYVGYSFAIDELDEAAERPLLITPVASEEGLYIHTSRQYRSWTDKSDDGGLSMMVMLKGANADAAALGGIADINTGVGQKNVVRLPLINHGYKGVTDLDCVCEVAGRTLTRHVELGDKRLYGYVNAQTTAEMEIEAIDKPGSYPMTITVTKVNGEDNADSENSVQTVLRVWDNLPVHRAVMEEYTGLWCGYCPRGWAAMEIMSKSYPDDFIGMAYHYGDDMEVTTDYPSSVEGFPMAFLDRVPVVRGIKRNV